LDSWATSAASASCKPLAAHRGAEQTEQFSRKEIIAEVDGDDPVLIEMRKISAPCLQPEEARNLLAGCLTPTRRPSSRFTSPPASEIPDPFSS
jgi:hypothetical protein